jgi:hypothetical protein
MQKSSSRNTEGAEVIALKALGFLAEEPERLQRFMDLSGLGLEAIRAGAADPGFLSGVFDHILADQTLLLLFAESLQLSPEKIAQMRRQLPGASLDF